MLSIRHNTVAHTHAPWGRTYPPRHEMGACRVSAGIAGSARAPADRRSGHGRSRTATGAAPSAPRRTRAAGGKCRRVRLLV